MQIQNYIEVKLFSFFNKTRTQKTRSDPEIFAGEGLAKLPIRRYNVPGGGGAPVTGCDPEGEWLTNKNSVWLPILTPVTAHTHPPSLRPFHARPHHVPCTRHVGDQNQVEVTEAVDREPHPSLFSTRHPAHPHTQSQSSVASFVIKCIHEVRQIQLHIYNQTTLFLVGFENRAITRQKCTFVKILNRFQINGSSSLQIGTHQIIINASDQFSVFTFTNYESPIVYCLVPSTQYTLSVYTTSHFWLCALHPQKAKSQTSAFSLFFSYSQFIIK